MPIRNWNVWKVERRLSKKDLQFLLMPIRNWNSREDLEMLKTMLTIPINAYQELKPVEIPIKLLLNKLEIPINAYQELKLYLETV